MKRVTQADLRGLYRPAPQSMYDGIHAALAPFPEGKEQPIVKKKISISIVLAAVLAIMSMTALAVSQLNLFRHMSEYGRPIVPLDGAESLVVKGLGHAENDFAVVTVEEAVYDRQGAMILARLALRQPEDYALFDDTVDLSETDEYVMERVPTPVGEVESIRDDHVEINNTPERQALLIDGVPVDIPTDEADALSKGLPVYQTDGALYYAGEWDWHILGRKDGRKIVYVNMNIDTMPGKDSNVFEESDDPFDSITYDCELQADGSMLCWFDCFAAQPLNGDLRMRIRTYLVSDDAPMEMDDIVFSMTPADRERKLTLVCENDGTISDALRIVGVEINQTKVRGYMNIDYDYRCDATDWERFVDFELYDAHGDRIYTSSGGQMPLENRDSGVYRQYMELQAFREIPESLTLKAFDASYNLIGQCVCKVVEEK